MNVYLDDTIVDQFYEQSSNENISVWSKIYLLGNQTFNLYYYEILKNSCKFYDVVFELRIIIIDFKTICWYIKKRQIINFKNDIFDYCRKYTKLFFIFKCHYLSWFDLCFNILFEPIMLLHSNQKKR